MTLTTRCSVGLTAGVLLTALSFLAGCSGGKTERKLVDVTGKVTLDGAPMATGQVSFDAGDGSAPSTVDVTGGSFSGKAGVGKMTVRISSFKKMPSKTSGPGAEAESLENIVLAKYNNESIETVEVKDPGPNAFDFKVTSK